MRDAGMKRVDDLVRDALLNPELARKLLMKGPESGAASRQIAIAQYLRRNSAAAFLIKRLAEMTANSEIAKSARNELAKFGISVEFTEAGLIELISRRGIKCTYSSRGYSPVIGFGADGRIFIRLISDGNAQLRINGQELEYSKHDQSLNMAVPK
jgi:hypothetical protein